MQRHWFYRLTDGLFTGDAYAGHNLADNTPEGCAAIDGVTDWRTQRVDLKTGELQAYTPPPPSLDDAKAAQLDLVQAAISTAEMRQGRPVREITQAMAAGAPPPQAATQRLAEIEAQIEQLRGMRAQIQAAATPEQLASITWP